jgi:hypothetical protein
MLVLIFSARFVQNISHSKKLLARYADQLVYGVVHVQEIILIRFYEALIFSTDFREIF